MSGGLKGQYVSSILLQSNEEQKIVEKICLLPLELLDSGFSSTLLLLWFYSFKTLFTHTKSVDKNIDPEFYFKLKAPYKSTFYDSSFSDVTFLLFSNYLHLQLQVA